MTALDRLRTTIDDLRALLELAEACTGTDPTADEPDMRYTSPAERRFRAALNKVTT